MTKSNLPVKIVITGPESSGKSTLAKALARALGAPLVEEFARPYLNWLGRNYTHNDLKTIALGQKSWEEWHIKNSKARFLVCDTDWTVIRVWEQFKYGKILYTKDAHFSANTGYLLCAPDIPWAEDPLRENPHERDQLFELYRHLLDMQQANYLIVSGSVAQRMEMSLDFIQKIS
jgi:nicotinamide riboside kinase